MNTKKIQDYQQLSVGFPAELVRRIDTLCVDGLGRAAVIRAILRKFFDEMDGSGAVSDPINRAVLPIKKGE